MRGFQQPLDDQRRDYQRQNGDLRRDHQRQTDDLRHDLEPLRASRRRVLYREVIVCAYSALGHNQNNPRRTTFE